MKGMRPGRSVNGLGNGLTDKVWSVLQDCWVAWPEARPTCEDVVHRIGLSGSVDGTDDVLPSMQYTKPVF